MDFISSVWGWITSFDSVWLSIVAFLAATLLAILVGVAIVSGIAFLLWTVATAAFSPMFWIVAVIIVYGTWNHFSNQPDRTSLEVATSTEFVSACDSNAACKTLLKRLDEDNAAAAKELKPLSVPSK